MSATIDEMVAEQSTADLRLIYDAVAEDFQQRLGRNPVEEGPQVRSTDRQRRQAEKKAKRRSAKILRETGAATAPTTE